MLVPVEEAKAKLSHEEIIEGMRKLRKRIKSGKMNVREMVTQGTAVLSGVVVDASVALAWAFPDEAKRLCGRGTDCANGRTILVPALWAIEITNAFLVAERRKRVAQSEVRRFVELLGELTVVMDSQGVAESVSNILPLGREHGLSAYDAAYLDVAVRAWRTTGHTRWWLAEKQAARRASRFSAGLRVRRMSLPTCMRASARPTCVQADR